MDTLMPDSEKKASKPIIMYIHKRSGIHTKMQQDYTPDQYVTSLLRDCLLHNFHDFIQPEVSYE